MNFIALLVSILALLLLLGLMGTRCSSLGCSGNCKRAHHNQTFHSIKHVSTLKTSSVAPWSIKVETLSDSSPAAIEYAVCSNCSVGNMIAQPIYIQISIYKRKRTDNGEIWCRCPHKLAVGCTCVTKQK